jgi:hypothetical protein
MNTKLTDRYFHPADIRSAMEDAEALRDGTNGEPASMLMARHEPDLWNWCISAANGLTHPYEVLPIVP